MILPFSSLKMSSTKVSITELSKDPSKWFDKDKPRSITICGWVKEKRTARAGTLLFLKMHDGDHKHTFQVVYDLKEGETDGSLKDCTNDATVKVTGKICVSVGKKQAYELIADEVSVLGACPVEDFPFRKTKEGYTMDYLRQFPHLRSKTETFAEIMKIRNTLMYETHRFFQDHDYVQIHTPILTTGDCEGAGETFKVSAPGAPKFFGEGKEVNLTVSGQLHVEPFALSLGKVYTFGPTFRAEKSCTSRHLAEFWMIEPEATFVDMYGMMDIVESYVRYVTKQCLDLHQLDSGVAEVLKNQIVEHSFKHVTYTDAVSLLKQVVDSKEVEFENTDIVWGMDLNSEHEQFLAKYYKGAIFITNYPKSLKAFYMYQDSDCDEGKETVSAFDLIVPGIGELAGGSQREHRLDKLEEAMTKQGMGSEMDWYRDTRKYGGAPHSGFGVGFERLVRLVSGQNNISDVIPYPIKYESITG